MYIFGYLSFYNIHIKSYYKIELLNIYIIIIIKIFENKSLYVSIEHVNNNYLQWYENYYLCT